LVGRDFYREALEIEEEELLDKILAITHERHLKKKEALIQAGETQNQIVFLVSGILRGFFLDAEGREVTDCFGLEPGTAAMGGFAFGKPSAITIEALTEAEVVWLPMAEVQELFARYPQLMAVYNRYLLKALNVHWELKTMIGQESAMVHEDVSRAGRPRARQARGLVPGHDARDAQPAAPQAARGRGRGRAGGRRPFGNPLTPPGTVAQKGQNLPLTGPQRYAIVAL